MKKYFSIIKNYVMIIFGAMLAAISIDFFLAPNKLAAGGVSGVATVLHYMTGFPIGAISLLLNIPLFAMGIRSEGKAFGAKSLFATFLMSFFIDLFSSFQPLINDVLLAALFGGLIMGLGLGLVLVSESTTGGTDIVAKLVQKSVRWLPIGRTLLVVDFLVIMFATIVFKDIKLGLYAVISLYASSYMIDTIVDGGKFAKTVFIISEQFDLISKNIKTDLKRGVTGLSGYGMYSGQKKTILMCTLKRNEIPKLKDLVRKIDASAFVILTDVREVLGEGFINNEGGKRIE